MASPIGKHMRDIKATPRVRTSFATTMQRAAGYVRQTSSELQKHTFSAPQSDLSGAFSI